MVANELHLLSLWQPWASLIAFGLKHYETRSWNTNYRGKVAIQAAKRPIDPIELGRLSFDLHAAGVSDLSILSNLPFGCIVAVVRLASCREMWDSQIYGPLMPPHRRGIDIASISALEKAVGDWQEGRFAWEQADIRPIAEPILCKGAQGLRVIRDEAVLTAIEQQLALTDSIEQQLQAIEEVASNA